MQAVYDRNGNPLYEENHGTFAPINCNPYIPRDKMFKNIHEGFRDMIVIETRPITENKITSNIVLKNGNHEVNAVALWDTGADRSCISENFVDELGLTPIGTEMVGGVTGTQEQNIYNVSFIFQYGAFNDFRVNGSNLSDPRFNVILGMDLIKMGNLSIETDGVNMVLMFSIPQH